METHDSLLTEHGRVELDAWIKFSRQDENSINSHVSQYDKGSILGALLDLETRKTE